MSEPIVKLEPGGQATIISYNVPEPTAYSGKNIIELEFDQAIFSDAAKSIPESRLKAVTEEEITKALDNAINSGVVDTKVFPNIRNSLLTRKQVGMNTIIN